MDKQADANVVINILSKRIAELEKQLAIQVAINAKQQNKKEDKNAKK